MISKLYIIALEKMIIIILWFFQSELPFLLIYGTFTNIFSRVSEMSEKIHNDVTEFVSLELFLPVVDKDLLQYW